MRLNGKQQKNQRGTAVSVWLSPVVIQTLPWKQRWVDLASRASILELLWGLADDEENLGVCWNQTRQRARRRESVCGRRLWPQAISAAAFGHVFTCKKNSPDQSNRCAVRYVVHDAFLRHCFFQGAKWFSLIVGKSLTLIICVIIRNALATIQTLREVKRSLTQAFSQIGRKGWITTQVIRKDGCLNTHKWHRCNTLQQSWSLAGHGKTTQDPYKIKARNTMHQVTWWVSTRNLLFVLFLLLNIRRRIKKKKQKTETSGLKS